MNRRSGEDAAPLGPSVATIDGAGGDREDTARVAREDAVDARAVAAICPPQAEKGLGIPRGLLEPGGDRWHREPQVGNWLLAMTLGIDACWGRPDVA